VWYSYAVIRIVPRVERGECMNAGVILFAREGAFLGTRIELDRARLEAFSPGVDVALIERHLETFLAVSAGDRSAGPIAQLPPAERFHWLTAPRSTVIQTSATHVGQADDPDATLEELLDEFVRSPAQA
jgi:hypothetical protein